MSPGHMNRVPKDAVKTLLTCGLRKQTVTAIFCVIDLTYGWDEWIKDPKPKQISFRTFQSYLDVKDLRNAVRAVRDAVDRNIIKQTAKGKKRFYILNENFNEWDVVTHDNKTGENYVVTRDTVRCHTGQHNIVTHDNTLDTSLETSIKRHRESPPPANPTLAASLDSILKNCQQKKEKPFIGNNGNLDSIREYARGRWAGTTRSKDMNKFLVLVAEICGRVRDGSGYCEAYDGGGCGLCVDYFKREIDRVADRPEQPGFGLLIHALKADFSIERFGEFRMERRKSI